MLFHKNLARGFQNSLQKRGLDNQQIHISHLIIIDSQSTPSMIQALKEFITSIDPDSDVSSLETAQELINELDFIQGEHSKKLVNSIDTLMSIIDNYILELPHDQKYSFVDILILCVEVRPSAFRKTPSRVEKLFYMICKVMANISDNIPDVWYHPPQDFSEDEIDKLAEIDPDTALVYRFRSFADRMGTVIGYEKTIDIIEPKAYSLYQEEDWRWKNAVLMFLSQLSEDFDIEKVGNIVNLIKVGSVHQHPKVRFAAIQALGQFSDDLKPNFQQKYFHELMPMIMKGFDDSVERVASHWMACMTNFIEDYSNTPEIIPYVNPLITKICYFIENGSSSSKENAIAALASLVTVPTLFDSSSISKPFEICHSVFQTFSVDNYKQVINQTFECITIALANQPFNLVSQYLPFTIEMLTQICDKIQVDYLVTGWHRICNLEKKFENWMPLFKKVLEATKTLPIDSMKPGFNSILSTVQCFKEDFYPFSAEVFQFLGESFINSLTQDHEETCISAIECLSEVLSLAKPANPDQNWDSCVKNTMMMYKEKVTGTIENDMLKVCENLLDSLKELLQNYIHLFSQQEIIEQYHSYIELFQKLKIKKQSTLNANEQMDEDVDEELLEDKKIEELSNINTCCLCIPDIIQIIIKNYSDKGVLITSTLQHVEDCFSSAIDDEDRRYAIYYMDNLLEDYDYDTLKDHWLVMYNYLAHFSVANSATLRNSAIFGLGLLAEKSPNEIVTMDTITAWMEVVKNAYVIIQQGKETKKVYGHCQDNCVAVVGKILKRYSKVFDLKFLYDKWLIALPLKFDHEENRQQMNNLCEILKKEPEVLLDGSVEGQNRLLKVFKIFAELVCNPKKKKLPEHLKMMSDVRETLLMMGNWPIYKENEQAILKSLTNNEQYQLKAFLTNQAGK